VGNQFGRCVWRRWVFGLFRNKWFFGLKRFIRNEWF
jgi:hypothetical protein